MSAAASSGRGAPPPGCPVLAGYDPLDPAELRDPYPGFRRARAEAPVFYDEKYGFWTVTRYEDVVAVLADETSFSNAAAIPMPLPPEDLRERMPVYPFETALLFLDHPEHRPARRMVQEPFVPRRLKEREPLIRRRAAGLLSAREDRLIDFRNDYAIPLALTVSGDLVGVPEADWPMLVDAVYGAFEIARIESGVVNDPARIRELAEEQARYWDYLVALAEERRTHPTGDFSSVLAAQVDPDDGSRLAAQEIAAHINTMFGGGFETSGQLLTWGVYAILKHRDQWELLKSDPSLLPGAVEECVRYRTVTKRIFRTVIRDVEVGGVEIPAGSLLALSLASANHDETVFDDPERFDIRRSPSPHNVTFGRGMHFCLGAPLAKAQLRITLEELMDLAPDARVVAEDEMSWKPDYRLEMVESLFVDLGPLA